MENNQSLVGSVVISGEGENKVSLVVKDPEGNQVFDGGKKKESSFELKDLKEGVYQVCFSNTDRGKKTISFSIETSGKTERRNGTWDTKSNFLVSRLPHSHLSRKSTEIEDEIQKLFDRLTWRLRKIKRNLSYQQTRFKTHDIGSFESNQSDPLSLKKQSRKEAVR